MSFLLLILIGALAGYFGARVMRLELTPVQSAALGALGAVLGAFALRLVLAAVGLLAGLAAAVAGALLLLWLWRNFVDRR